MGECEGARRHDPSGARGAHKGLGVADPVARPALCIVEEPDDVDGDIVDEHAPLQEGSVGGVAETEFDLRAGVGRKVEAHLDPPARIPGDAVLEPTEVNQTTVGVEVGGDSVHVRQLHPGFSAVCRHLKEGVVPVLFDGVVGPEGERDGRRSPAEVEVSTQAVVRPVGVVVAPPHALSAVRHGERRDLIGQADAHAIGAAEGRIGALADLDGAWLIVRVHDHGVRPAQHPLIPEPHVSRDGLEDWAAVAPGVHQIPELDVAFAAAHDVVEVGQAQIVAELVGEDPHARILRLHDVVENPDIVVGVTTGGRGAAREVAPDGGHYV